QATSPEHKIEGLETGADDYLTKPVNIGEFRARVRTIARLQEATSALRASERHYRRLVEIMPDAVSLIHFDGRLVELNHQTLRLLGSTAAEDLLRKTVFDLALPEDQARLRADLAAAQTEGSLRNVEYTFLRKSGEPFPVEVCVGILRGGNGQAR